MELPFLKKKQKFAGGGMAMQEMREPDEASDDQMLDAVADEFLQAIERKDKRALREALEALVLHIKDQDDKQDEAE